MKITIRYAGGGESHQYNDASSIRPLIMEDDNGTEYRVSFSPYGGGIVVNKVKDGESKAIQIQPVVSNEVRIM